MGSEFFFLGDLVREIQSERVGTIERVYLNNGQCRFVVAFNDGNQGVFFDYELGHIVADDL